MPLFPHPPYRALVCLFTNLGYTWSAKIRFKLAGSLLETWPLGAIKRSEVRRKKSGVFSPGKHFAYPLSQSGFKSDTRRTATLWSYFEPYYLLRSYFVARIPVVYIVCLKLLEYLSWLLLRSVKYNCIRLCIRRNTWLHALLLFPGPHLFSYFQRTPI